MVWKEKILEANNLHWVQDGKTIIDVDHFYLKHGETVALIGPNGAGKSSLIKLLGLLNRPSEGEILFLGKSVERNVLAVRRQMAMVFQEPLLLNGTVFGNVVLGLKLRGVSRKETEERASFWMKSLDIHHLAGRHIRALSGGEAQRVSIARAMAVEPRVLFLDEPFSSLDLPTRGSLMEKMADILHQSGTATIFITHNTSEIPFLASRVCVLSEGKIIQSGGPEEIFRFPCNEVAAKLVGVDNILEGVFQHHRAQVDEISLSLGDSKSFPPGEMIKLFIRSREIIMNGEGQDFAENRIIGIVKKFIPYEQEIKIVLDCGFPLQVSVDKNFFYQEKERLRIGDQVQVYIPPDKVHAIKS